MRPLNLLPLYILVLSTAASAQSASAPTPDAAVSVKPVALRTEAVPEANPDGLTINPSKSAIKLLLLTRQRAELAAQAAARAGVVAAAPTAVSAGTVLNPKSTLPVSIAPEASLQQPGLPAAALVPRAGLLPAAAAAGAPVSNLAEAPANAVAAVTPPPPVFQTMKQAAQAQEGVIKSALNNVGPVGDENPPSRLQQILDFVQKHRQNSLIGGAVLVLLAFFALRRRSPRADDDTEE